MCTHLHGSCILLASSFDSNRYLAAEKCLWELKRGTCGCPERRDAVHLPGTEQGPQEVQSLNTTLFILFYADFLVMLCVVEFLVSVLFIFPTLVPHSRLSALFLMMILFAY